jgi:hypothetical protein
MIRLCPFGDSRGFFAILEAGIRVFSFDPNAKFETGL